MFPTVNSTLRDALEAVNVSASLFRPSTLQCEVGVYIDIPESFMITESDM
jgi:hypothetical protein